jgi:hypothetical protein
MENVVDFLDRFRSGSMETNHMGNPGQTREIKNECLELFLKAAQEINKRYLPGTISYVGKNHPELDKEIDESELAVNKIWFAVERGEATIKELRDAIAKWYRLNLKAITIFSRHGDNEKKFNISGSTKS